MTKPLILALLLLWLSLSTSFYVLKLDSLVAHPYLILSVILCLATVFSCLGVLLYQYSHPVYVSNQLRLHTSEKTQSLLLSWLAHVPIELQQITLPSLQIYSSAELNGFSLTTKDNTTIALSNSLLNNVSPEEIDLLIAYLSLHQQQQYTRFVSLVESFYITWILTPLACLRTCTRPLIQLTVAKAYREPVQKSLGTVLRWSIQLSITGPALLCLRAYQRHLIYAMDAKLAQHIGHARLQRFLTRAMASEDLHDERLTCVQAYTFHQPTTRFTIFHTHPSLQKRHRALNAIGNLC